MSAGDNAECGTQCQEALAQLERYLDGELPNTTLDEIKTHLAACYPCTDRASFEEQLRAIVRRDCVDAPPPSLLVRIREHLATVHIEG
ncbi:mycothiol system anti-sigma-R factor [Egicoccus sp. AB-alg2]|uniref:mycothiol system anti-sigma-R factor n=1 Tax=Egicoccus sp. AB-alg2 TaxID=3242693 RepID=UPI00359DE2C5